MKFRFLFLMIAALFFSGAAQAESSPALTLSSGEKISILSMTPMQVPQVGPSLFVQYATSIDRGDPSLLRREVNEIWNQLADGIDQQGYQQAIINVLLPEKTDYPKDRQINNFIFQKEAGAWRALNSQKEFPSTLNTIFIKTFMANADWAYEHDQMNAFLLYLSGDWKGVFTKGSNPPKTIDRLTLAADTHKALSQTKDFHHRRDIGKITFSPDALSAQVESDEIEEGTVNKVHHQTVEHSTDTIELRNGIPVITKTVTFLQEVD